MLDAVEPAFCNQLGGRCYFDLSYNLNYWKQLMLNFFLDRLIYLNFPHYNCYILFIFNFQCGYILIMILMMRTKWNHPQRMFGFIYYLVGISERSCASFSQIWIPANCIPKKALKYSFFVSVPFFVQMAVINRKMKS